MAEPVVGEDVFRYVVERPVQLHPRSELEARLVSPYGEVGESGFAQKLRNMPDGRARRRAAEELPLAGGLDALPLLASLDGWFFTRADSLKLEELHEHLAGILAQAKQKQQLAQERTSAADTLIARTILGRVEGYEVDGLVRALRLAAVVERADAFDDERQLTEILRGGLIELPGDVVGVDRANEPNTDTVGAHRDKEAPPIDHDSDARATADPATRLVAIDKAVRTLRAALTRTESPVAGGGAEGDDGAQPPWMIPRDKIASLLDGDDEALTALGVGRHIDAPRAIGALEAVARDVAQVLPSPTPSTVVRLGSAIVPDPRAWSPTISSDVLAGVAPPERIGAARVLGVGELRVVRQRWLGYELGEVARIENVLRGEVRERRHRRTDTREEVLVTETERDEESQEDLQSTDRFELQQETQRTLHQDSQVEANVHVSGEYGPTVKVEAGFGYASHTAKDDADRTAARFAHETTSRAIHRVRERVREQRTVRTVTRVDELNRHGLTNTNGAGNVRGVYRFVNKVYEAQTYIYAGRLLLEVVLPEPAHFYRWAAGGRQLDGVTVDPVLAPHVDLADAARLPVAPVSGKTRDLRPEDLSSVNVGAWVAAYKVPGVTPAPPEYKSTSLVLTKDSAGAAAQSFHANSDKLAVDDGYQASQYWFAALFDGPNKVRDDVLFAMLVGEAWPWTQATPNHVTQNWAAKWGGTLDMDPGAHVPVAVYVDGVSGFSATIVVQCHRTDAAMTTWQDDTYEKIVQAYYSLKRSYDEQVQTARARVMADVQGRNPTENRIIEATELKRSAIAMLRKQPLDGFDPFTRVDGKAPELQPVAAEVMADTVSFFEQAFEWRNMQYTFYPYYWTRKEDWASLSQVEEVDPLFGWFLRAGAARVVIPVRPGWETRVVNYALDRQIPRGTTLDDPLYYSIDEEIREQQADVDTEGKPTGVPWRVTLPTDLVYVQDDEAIPRPPAPAEAGHV
jgi:hypothetical protein